MRVSVHTRRLGYFGGVMLASGLSLGPMSTDGGVIARDTVRESLHQSRQPELYRERV